MADNRYDITIEKGVPWSFTFDLDNSTTLDYDFSNYSIQCQIRSPQGKIVASPIGAINSVGIVTLKLTANEVNLIPTTCFSSSQFDVYEYNVKLVAPDVNIDAIIVLYGKAFVKAGVTY